MARKLGYGGLANTNGARSFGGKVAAVLNAINIKFCVTVLEPLRLCPTVIEPLRICPTTDEPLQLSATSTEGDC